MRKLAVILMLIVTVSSCFEEDIMVPRHEQGDLLEGIASQGSSYERQVFYDLQTNREVSSNLISEWDLCFEKSGGLMSIRLNSSKFMWAGNSYDTAFLDIIDRADLEMRFDRSDGDPDSTAIGTWFDPESETVSSLEHVYLVDRGIDIDSSNTSNSSMGFRKVQFRTENNDFLVRHANPDNTDEITSSISWDGGADRVYYSFDNGIVEIEPGPTGWSLLFSRYTTMLFYNEGEPYPYLVTGVLLNPSGVSATLDTIHDFPAIELADTVDLEFTFRSDVIGYEWKYYNFDDDVYTIEPGMAYVIRDRDGLYYKLRFIDFYNDTGEKGHPTFEYVRL